MRRVWLLLLLSACNRGGGAASGGTIVLQVQSTTPVDNVKLRVFDPKGATSEFSFDTAGRDLTKEKAVGEITPGTLIASGKVLIVGQGYSVSKLAGSGRSEATFQPGQKVTATLILKADVVDVDQDGYSKQEDCDDTNSKRNVFFQDVCGNDLDDDCDGTADNGCPCVNGVTRPCYDNADGATRGVGDCRDGTQSCSGGVWGACQGSVGPGAETCNGRDEDCDGTVDETCPCTMGTQRFCNGRKVSSTTGSAADLMLVGECAAGTQKCVGSAWGLCEGAITPTDEDCNGKDDDCDGTFDDGFDGDGDGFTSCGTVNGVCATAPVGGTASNLIDCDDGDATRHPCQDDHCGDGNVDDDCSGSGNECTVAAGTCQSAGYYAGWQASGGRGRSECRFAGNSYGTECDANTLLCKTPAAQCSVSPGIGIAVADTRAICTEVGGCDSGTTNAPTHVSLIVNQDPYNDCGIIACDGRTGGQIVYAGRTAGTDTGWRINGSQFECRTFPDVAAAQTRCGSAGACEGPVTACQRTYTSGQGTVVAPSGILATACRVPSGYVSPSNLGTTCVTPSGGTSVPPSSAAFTGTDPLARCPTGSSACIGTVSDSNGWSVSLGTATCDVIATQGGSPQSLCAAGACSSSLDLSTCGGNGSSIAQRSCNSKCFIPSACPAGNGPNPVNFCYDLTGGVKGHTGCAAGQTCEGVSEASSTCKNCVFDLACGTSCNACLASQTCAQGINSDGSANPGDPVSTPAANVACLCPAPALSSSANIQCAGAAGGCCAPGEACINGACASATASRVACMPGADLNGSTCPINQFCNTTGSTFVCASCAASVLACGQRCCPTGERCSNKDTSVCESCIAQTACGTGRVNCNASGFKSTRTCGSNGVVGPTCGQLECFGSCGGTVGNGVACATGATGPTSQCIVDGACGPSCQPCNSPDICKGSGGIGKDYFCGPP